MPCLIASLPAPLPDESENAPNAVEQLSGLSNFDNFENMHAETETERVVFDNRDAEIAETEPVIAETENQHAENGENVDVHDEYVENVPENDVDLHDYQLARDRTRRDRKKPSKFDDFHMTSYAFGVFESIDNCEPKCYEEALKSANSLQWMNAMREEINSLHSVNIPLAAHFVLSKDQSPKTDSEIDLMKNVSYSNAIGFVMYLMVSTRPDIAYAVSCLSRYMSNPVDNVVPPWLEKLFSSRIHIDCIANSLCFYFRSSALLSPNCGIKSLAASSTSRLAFIEPSSRAFQFKFATFSDLN
ncbi:Unknown protein [Striga hermonthica]|uniref:Uncharacterized protein n=1 Tax=Striga hermonthica TaxID=68872 RepID=A0A9N7N616_STRHE|nr:Unknown protein [Striga hermonthica]